MPDYITIDGGTTNTRISLVSDRAVTDTRSFSVGARSGMDNAPLYRNTIKQGIAEILKASGRTEGDIKRVLASGMITSEFGLVDLPHTVAPVGIGQLHGSAFETTLADICNIPFVFIRGVRTEGEGLASVDMMRGEETEVFGLDCGEGLYILSGSHTKLVLIDGSGKITDIKTLLTGEMIAALSGNTILKSSVDLKGAKLDEEYLVKGCEYTKTHGINNALFKVRILCNILGADPDKTYSFFMGAVLCGEVEYILSLESKNIYISGQRQIKTALAELLCQKTKARVTVISDKKTADSTTLGMINIYEYKE